MPARHPAGEALAVSRRLTEVFRAEHARVLAVLVGDLRDLDLAEESLADAYAEATAAWRTRGIPDRPAAWLLTVARRRAIDRLRRGAAERRRIPLLVVPEEDPGTVGPDEIPDERLRLVFTCCHPALPIAGQVALTLRVIAGLTTAEIARAFVVSEPTMGQRISRAKRKIHRAGIPYRVPSPQELPARLPAVLRVVYLVFNEGHTSTSGRGLDRVDLQREALALARVLAELLPRQPEVLGLLALLLLTGARAAARVDARGELVRLEQQDRSRWDAGAISEGLAVLAAARALGTPGSYTLQAEIAAVHARAPTWADTDWRAIVDLYDRLVALRPDPVVSLNRAVAIAMTGDVHTALEEVDALATDLSGYHHWYATRGELLLRSGSPVEAGRAFARAVELTTNGAERRHLRRRIDASGAGAPGDRRTVIGDGTPA